MEEEAQEVSGGARPPGFGENVDEVVVVEVVEVVKIMGSDGGGGGGGRCRR